MGATNTLLPHSIAQVSQQFADDILLLRELLPGDLSRSFRKRVGFVLHRKETEKVLQRLEQRKSAAALALGIVGRTNDIRLQGNMSSLQVEIQRLFLNQDAVLGAQNLSQQVALEESRQRSNDIMTSLRELQRAPAGAAGGVPEIQSSLDTISTLQNDMVLSSRRLEDAIRSGIQESRSFRQSQAQAQARMPATLVAENADVLARLVRAELRQQLEPLLERIDGVAEHIDRVALAISGKADAESVVQTEELGSAPQDFGREMFKPEVSLGFQRIQLDSNTQANSGAVKLFSARNYYLTTKFGTLRCQLRTCQPPRCAMGRQRGHFELTIDVFPRLFFSRGISLLYSSSPNSRGYYSICPSIATFGIIPRESPVWALLRSDDKLGVEAMIERGEVNILDRSGRCANLLEVR